MKCSKCAEALPPGGMFCPTCGTAVNDIKCRFCDQPSISSGQTFCPICGGDQSFDESIIPAGLHGQYNAWLAKGENGFLETFVASLERAFRSGIFTAKDIPALESVFAEAAPKPLFKALMVRVRDGKLEPREAARPVNEQPSSEVGASTSAPSPAANVTSAPSEPSVPASGPAVGASKRTWLIAAAVVLALGLISVMGTRGKCVDTRMRMGIVAGMNEAGGGNFDETLDALTRSNICPIGGKYSYGPYGTSCSIHGKITEADLRARGIY